jgi:hypothetical protein
MKRSSAAQPVSALSGGFPTVRELDRLVQTAAGHAEVAAAASHAVW